MAIFNVPIRLSRSTSSRPIVVFIAYSCPKAKRHNQIQTDIVDGLKARSFFHDSDGSLQHRKGGVVSPNAETNQGKVWGANRVIKNKPIEQRSH